MSAPPITRRGFLLAGAAAGTGLVIGTYLPWLDRRGPANPAAPFTPNVWIRIDPDGTVTLWCARSEMGQGVRTAMPMIVAEELDVAWDAVQVVQADGDPAYGSQFTTGSRSVTSGWEPLRKAGAAAREMLIEAAAREWGVARSGCRAQAGVVEHAATGRRLGYDQLASAAAALPVPSDPPLKTPSSFRIVGTRIPRVDTPAKVTGSARFGTDVRVPGMRYAAIARSPVFGGTLVSVDDTAARAVPGVQDIVQIDRGVAVIAENTWAAFRGRDALECTWDEGPTARWSSDEISRALAAALAGGGETVRTDGDVSAGIRRAEHVIEATYEAPYLAHATMEPMNATADVRDGRCEIWAPTQAPQRARAVAARRLGLAEDAVTVHVTYLGGGFGRKSATDAVEEAVDVSRAIGAPVQVVWSREDDMRHGAYRPATYNVLRAAFNADGEVLAWYHQLAGPPGGGWMVTRGADDVRYAIPNLRVDRHTHDAGIPVTAWRGVGPSQNGFVVESFLDELAHAAGVDPYRFRRRLLAPHPRFVAVLDLAAARAGWETPAAAGRHRGIAIMEFGGTIVAQVAEVSVTGDQAVHVHRVVSAVDCGIVVNPDIVEAQMESAVVYGLTAALHGEITIDRGRVEQSNFHDYQMLRMPAMPAVETYFVESDRPPTGIGEPGLPPIAPAVCNAIYAGTGTRVRKLPISLV